MPPGRIGQEELAQVDLYDRGGDDGEPQRAAHHQDRRDGAKGHVAPDLAGGGAQKAAADRGADDDLCGDDDQGRWRHVHQMHDVHRARQQHGPQDHPCRKAQQPPHRHAHDRAGQQDARVQRRDRADPRPGGRPCGGDAHERAEEDDDGADHHEDPGRMGERYVPLVPARLAARLDHVGQPARHRREIGGDRIEPPDPAIELIADSRRHQQERHQQRHDRPPVSDAGQHLGGDPAAQQNPDHRHHERPQPVGRGQRRARDRQHRRADHRSEHPRQGQAHGPGHRPGHDTDPEGARLTHRRIHGHPPGRCGPTGAAGHDPRCVSPRSRARAIWRCRSRNRSLSAGVVSCVQAAQATPAS